MAADKGHIYVLDGWRGISILLVLAAHLLPLGPNSLGLNYTAGASGMALFFTLSGLLITKALLKRQDIPDFLMRRFARIVPLAWLCTIIALIWVNAPLEKWLANLFFYANWPPMQLTAALGPLWSLCVEVQFYIGIAALVLLLGKRGLLVLPLLCIGVTALRMFDGIHIAINTYYRLDEILVGCVLALILANRSCDRLSALISKINPFIIIILFFASCHPEAGFASYFRPYFAALLVGWTLVNGESSLNKIFQNKALVYVATISYALYMIHPLLDHSWLGSGETFEKYLKRPLLFIMLFMLAHISTFHFEHRCIAWAKARSKRISEQKNIKAQI